MDENGQEWTGIDKVWLELTRIDKNKSGFFLGLFSSGSSTEYRAWQQGQIVCRDGVELI